MPLSDRHRAPGPRKPASDARRAAEALFSAEPRQPASASRAAAPAQVIVRRSRLPQGMTRHAAVDTAAPAADLAPPAKDPRVFRLVPATPARGATPLPDAAPAAARPRRGGRASPDRRPGPVTRLLEAVARPVSGASTPARAAELAAQLSRVAPVLAEIERARAFTFLDDRHEPDWQRLLQRAAALARELGRPDA